MNYELAKKLKDAGFPQKGLGVFDCPHDYCGQVDWEEDRCSAEVYIPTLSELIEACGTNNSNGEFYLEWDLEEWESGFYEDSWGESRSRDVRCTGPTPDIAVANLWLALNKKP